MAIHPKAGRTCTILALFFAVSQPAKAAEWFVAPGGSGGGTIAAPFGRIQQAMRVALPGDVITVRPGVYEESLRTVRHGTADKPIRLRAGADRGSVLLTKPGRVLTVEHAYFILEGMVLDGQYGAADTVRIGDGAHFTIFRNNEIRRSKHDLVDIGGPTGVLIENCLIHHALNSTNGRTDAHGIVAGPVQQLTIRDTEIHTFSGDGIQLDPDRRAPGWRDVRLEDLRIWLQPLASPDGGFGVGVVPGENAVDTKAAPTLPRATLTMRNITAWGFRDGLVSNMAAFNLKEHIDAVLDGVTVHSSHTAFRLRGDGANPTGAWVALQNAVIYDVLTAYRYEEDIQNLRIWHSTIGAGVHRAFDAASSTSAGLEVRNLLILGPRPSEAEDASNLAVGDRTFVDAASHDYRLRAGAPAIDAGVSLPNVSFDRSGVKRSVGAAPDVGAYEWQPPTARPKKGH